LLAQHQPASPEPVNRTMRLCRFLGLLAVGLVTAIGLPACELGSNRLKVAFISNNPHEFWTIARNGTAEAAAKFDVDVEFYMPANGTAAEQHRIIEDLVAKGVKGIAISPNDAAHQSRVLNRIIPDSVGFITQDSDLPPTSKRKCYIGTNNIKAGRAVGQLVKEAIPTGGEIMVYVGMLDVQNAQERRQGVIAALAGEPNTDEGDARAKKIGEGSYPLRLGPGGKYVVLGTMTDEASQSKCKANVEDTLAKHKNVKCLVGLWAYNPPAMLQAVRESVNAGVLKKGQIKMVGFDEDEQTLQGIKDGDIHATVVQNPYMFGYESVRILQHLARKGTLPEPEDNKIQKVGTNYFVKHRVIKRKKDVKPGQLFDEDVEAFHEDLKLKKR
jgi:ribose transport system substrate-binding protein